ncbi:hypothetical protein SRB5_55650 [Streptomyces sp. RB5]|uniref:ABC3 transporter permease C-terminal domain-containing protein n=1 Tax=Streptomyces smaragdinus TaxID=2585196 RepID=A0A7K0CPH3_9ACTN|nr:ABC transporter permease [Streptomyces smaragdinus]MQY15386.1 hypothetical protein [Streptomyces smaragdinus]
MMLRLALRTLRARLAGFLGSFVALLCAAALTAACGVLLETGLRGTIAPERLAAAPVVVSADQNVHQTKIKEKKGKRKVKHKAKPLAERVWLPEELAGRIAHVPGVRAAVPELTFPARPVTPGGPPSYGHAWQSAALAPYTLGDGRAPRTAGEIVVDRGLAERAGLTAGDRIEVQSTGAPKRYTVTGVTTTALAHQSSLFFSAEEARRLAGHPGQVTAIGVLARDGVSAAELGGRIDAALDGTGAKVSTGAGRGPVEFLDAAGARVKLVSMGGAIAGTSLLVAVLVVVGTFALGIQQRHRELALLRAVAATSGQIRRLIGREALLIGLAAGVLGAAAGLPLGTWLLGRFVDLGAVPATLHPAVSVFPALAAVALTLLGAWAAARISARRISRIGPAEALTEAATERRPAAGRIVAGVLLLAGGAVLVAVLGGLRTEPAATPVTFLAVVVLATAVSLLGPLVVRAGTALLAGPLRLARFSGRMARANLRGRSVRMAAAVTPLALLIGMASTVLFVQPTLSHAADRQAAEGTLADYTLASTSIGVPPQAAAAVRSVTGVTAATEVVRTTVRVGLDKYPAQGVTPSGLDRTWDPDVRAGSLRGFGPGDVAVSELAADQLGLKPGGTLKLTLGDGTKVSLEVAAVYAKGLGFGDLTMAHDLIARHVDNPLAVAVNVRTDGSAARADLAAAVRAFPGVQVLDPGQAHARTAGVQQANAEVNFLAMGLVLAFTAIAVVNTLAMTTAERVREFAQLRLAGAQRRQVLRMLRLEALSVVAMALVAGTGIALAVLTAFAAGMTGGAPALEPLTYALVVGVATLLALASTALPGRVALAPRPVDVATAPE